MSFRIIYFVLFSSAIINSEVLASSGECSYELKENTGYSCDLEFHKQKDVSKFTSIDGDHEEDKTDDDVVSVWIDNEVHNPGVTPFICSKFKNLERLFIKQLVLTEIPEDSFNNCKNLKELIIRSHQFVEPHLSQLPQNLLAGNPKLTSFEAKLQALQTLPENFFANSPNLRKINLSQNKIRTLPDDIFKSLVNLNELVLLKNDIYDLNPAWFEGHENLQTIILEQNKISDIPKNIFASLKNLNKLYMPYNRLAVIHADSFGQLPKLEHIDFKFNEIDAIDEKFIDNIGVKYFQIYKNNCASAQYNNDEGEKSELKDGLKKCFKNYHPRA